VKKVLFIRFSSIGDIVLTTPLLRVLKQQRPETEIHYLTKKSFQAILLENPYITKIHSLEGGLAAVLEELKNEDFDFVIDLHRSLRSRVVKARLQKPSATFAKLNRAKWLLVNTKINILPNVHIVDRYFTTLKRFNVKNDGKGLDYYLPEHASEKVEQSLPKTIEKGSYLLVVTGSKHKTKQIPKDKTARICNEAGLPVVLAGSVEDRQGAEDIMQQLTVPAFNSCGLFDINESAWLVKQSRVVLSPDTGLMHIAAAFQKPLVTMWGNTVPAFGMYPYYPLSKQDYYRIHEVRKLHCRPCSKLGFERCPQGHFRCMNEIPEHEVVSSIRQLAEFYK